MNEILALVLGSMQSDVARMNRVGLNLANAQTVGYKREIVAALPFAQRVQAGEAPTATSLVHTDQRPGTLRPTGQPLDVALAGPGWLEVATPEGTAYTRQGNLRLDAQGRIVTAQGQPVMGLAGEIRLQHGAPVIDAAGRVFEGAAPGGAPGPVGAPPLAQLKIVQFAPGAAVQPLADGLVRVAGEPSLAAEGDVQVRQGFLENSNVSTMHEMVRLIETLRHMETLQKVAIGYDELLATSIRRLGEGA